MKRFFVSAPHILSPRIFKIFILDKNSALSFFYVKIPTKFIVKREIQTGV